MIINANHFIHNFPKDYPFYKKILANFIYLTGGIIIHDRENSLTHKDLATAIRKVKKGDILLTANLHESSSIAIKGTFTHALLYLGHRQLISAEPDGVKLSNWHDFAINYDCLTILRIPNSKKNIREITKNACAFAKKQIGKPYNYFFTGKENSFFCTELINSSYHHAGYKTGLATIRPTHNLLEKIEKKITSAKVALHPTKLLEGNFESIFTSHNLTKNGNKIELNKTKNKKII